MLRHIIKPAKLIGGAAIDENAIPKIMKKSHKSFLHHAFRLTILIKGVDGILDMAGSAILYLSGPNSISKIVPMLVRGELIEDPKDIIGNYLLNASQGILPSTHLFIVVYLAVHGLAKIGIASALSSNNHKAYRTAEILLIFFICYQIYRFGHTQSITLLMLSLVDILILALAESEYRRSVGAVNIAAVAAKGKRPYTGGER